MERQLGRPAPAILRELYADYVLLRSAPFTVFGSGGDGAEWDVADFNPADGRGDTFWIPPGAFCFATMSFDDPYYVEVAAGVDDGPVSVHYHDGGEIERIAGSLAQFLSWPRKSDPSELSTATGLPACDVTAAGSFVRVLAGVVRDFENLTRYRVGGLNVFISDDFEDRLSPIVEGCYAQPAA